VLTPINGSNPPTQDVSTIRRIMEERRIFDSALYAPFQEAVRKIWSDIENLYRLHREDGGNSPGGGGGATTPITQKKQIIVYPLCNIVSEDMAVGYNEYVEAFESSTSIRWSLHAGRHNARYFQPVGNDCQIQSICGTLWFQPKEGGSVIPAQQHFIKMNLFQGSPDLSGNNLLGFDFGFERFGHPLDPFARGKFFLDVFEYPQETTQTPVTLLSDEISVSSRKYYSTSPILNDTLISDYFEHGLWCRLNLTIFVS
jgi:hypothetical protein